MIELKLGETTNAELASWFGIAESTLRNTKHQRLEELKNFAEFEEVHGKINITKIFFPVYVKGDIEDTLALVDKYWGDLNTTANVAKKLQKKLKISYERAFLLAQAARNKNWGTPFSPTGPDWFCAYT